MCATDENRRKETTLDHTLFTIPLVMYVHSLNSKSAAVFLCGSIAVNTYFKSDHMFFAAVYL